jgi:hypothetical protein
MRTVLIATVLAAPLLAHAQVYRWVDAQGHVHYTQDAPAQKDFKKVDVPVAQSSSSPNLDSLHQYSQQNDKANAAQAKADATAKQSAADAKQACTQARAALDELSAKPAARFITPDGNRMSVEQHDAEIAKAQKVAQDSCK